MEEQQEQKAAFPPQGFVLPTPGRIVHFYPSKTDHSAKQNGAQFIPAMVIQSWGGDMANLRIFPYGMETDVLRGSCHHKDSPDVGESYWVYPPR